MEHIVRHGKYVYDPHQTAVTYVEDKGLLVRLITCKRFTNSLPNKLRLL